MKTVQESFSHKNDKRIPYYFVLFFVVVAILDGIFVYTAITTQTGVVTEQAYEKGLAYDETLAQATTQAEMNLVQTATFKDGKLAWSFENPPENLKIKAHIVRPVQSGYDFDVDLTPVEAHIYSAEIKAPLKGRWRAELEATWQTQDKTTQTYRRTLEFLVP